MDTTWFQDFLAVLEEGGFTRAAERRAVSQPAFSETDQSPGGLGWREPAV